MSAPPSAANATGRAGRPEPGRPLAEYAARLRAFRTQHGLSQRALAAWLGVSERSVIRWEQGRAYPAPAVWRRLGAEVPAVERHNLPAEFSRFVGRAQELAELERRLGATRLLTLTGAPGVGKTSLALRLAAQMLPVYPDGVWLVELAGLADPALVPHTVAAAFGLGERPGRPVLEMLRGGLQRRRLLLVLDTCEHLLGACAALASTVLHACPAVRILATSRAALGLAGETVWRVPSLPVPAPPSPVAPEQPEQLWPVAAVQLLVDRVQAIQPDFQLRPDNAAAVAEICRRLDGIPLALELAAARAAVLSVEQIAARLDDRFRLLVRGSRAALPRQQTLRAAVDWSYDLLEEAERALFRRLAVFDGSFALEAAEAVCAGEGLGPPEPAAALDLLGQLVAQSLVQVQQHDGQARYHLLETLRQYAWERLEASGEAELVRWRHAAHYLAQVESVAPDLAPDDRPVPAAHLDEATAVRRLTRDRDNLRAALQWAIDAGQVELGLRLATDLQIFWRIWGAYAEGRRWLLRLLAAGPAPARLCARALNALGDLALQQGDHAEAAARAQQSLELQRAVADSLWQRAGSLSVLGHAASQQDDAHTAQELHTAALACARAAGSWWLEAANRYALGRLALQRGASAEACGWYAGALAVARDGGDPWSEAFCLTGLGWAALAEQDQEAARAHLAAALPLEDRTGDRNLRPWCLVGLGYVALETHYPALAERLFMASLAAFEAVADKRGLLECLEALAVLAATQAKTERALRLAGAAAAHRAGLSLAVSPFGPVGRTRLEGWLERLRPKLSGAVAAAWNAGQALSLAEAVATAQRGCPTPAAALEALPGNAATSAPRTELAHTLPPHAGSPGQALAALTPRECEVLDLAAAGRSSKEIARVLGVSRRTVDHHFAAIYAKTGARSRAAAVAQALGGGAGRAGGAADLTSVTPEWSGAR